MPKRAEQLRRADAGELEKLRRSDRAGRDNDLAPCTRSLNAIASTVFDTRRFGALENDSKDVRVGDEAKVCPAHGGAQIGASCRHPQPSLCGDLV